MNKPYDFAVFIGRFQPFHEGHAQVIEHGLTIANEVIVLVGSSNRASSTRNPFSYTDRGLMIASRFPEARRDSRLMIMPLNDVAYDDQEWVTNVQSAVKSVTGFNVNPSIALIGSDKDNSTYYLRLFPQWNFEPLVGVETIDATTIRNLYFTAGSAGAGATGHLAPSTIDFLAKYQTTDCYQQLVADFEFAKKYKFEWGLGPFVTVDAVVVQSGHVLLVERGRDPGKGQLAIPGGFLERDETLLHGALRELREETGLNIDKESAPFLLRARETFDDPYRSSRARIITTAFLFELPAGPLPMVVGQDDAAAARWVPISELRVNGMFEDHGFIISHLLNKAK